MLLKLMKTPNRAPSFLKISHHLCPRGPRIIERPLTSSRLRHNWNSTISERLSQTISQPTLKTRRDFCFRIKNQRKKSPKRYRRSRNLTWRQPRNKIWRICQNWILKVLIWGNYIKKGSSLLRLDATIWAASILSIRRRKVGAVPIITLSLKPSTTSKNNNLSKIFRYLLRSPLTRQITKIMRGIMRIMLVIATSKKNPW